MYRFSEQVVKGVGILEHDKVADTAHQHDLNPILLRCRPIRRAITGVDGDLARGDFLEPCLQIPILPPEGFQPPDPDVGRSGRHRRDHALH